MNKNLGGLRGQKFPKTRNVAQVIEGRLQTEFFFELKIDVAP